MSLVNEYRLAIRGKLGLSDKDPVIGCGPTTEGSADGIGSMDEKSLNSMLELLSREIAKREAVGETEEAEGMEEPVTSGNSVPEAGQPPAPVQPGASVSIDEAHQVADDVYFEMLNAFKENVSKCQESGRKRMYAKCYEMCYKMREKFIKEMTTVEEPSSATPIN
jgi:hypothetical protein